MKQLYHHIGSCGERRCDYPHCISSRYVVSHFSWCRDEQCPCCWPVRLFIRMERGQGQGQQAPAGPTHNPLQ